MAIRARNNILTSCDDDITDIDNSGEKNTPYASSSSGESGINCHRSLVVSGRPSLSEK